MSSSEGDRGFGIRDLTYRRPCWDDTGIGHRGRLPWPHRGGSRLLGPSRYGQPRPDVENPPLECPGPSWHNALVGVCALPRRAQRHFGSPASCIPLGGIRCGHSQCGLPWGLGCPHHGRQRCGVLQPLLQRSVLSPLAGHKGLAHQGVSVLLTLGLVRARLRASLCVVAMFDPGARGVRYQETRGQAVSLAEGLGPRGPFPARLTPSVGLCKPRAVPVGFRWACERSGMRYWPFGVAPPRRRTGRVPLPRSPRSPSGWQRASS